MEKLVRDGLRLPAELPEELSWLALVEDNFHLLPKLLQVTIPFTGIAFNRYVFIKGRDCYKNI